MTDRIIKPTSFSKKDPYEVRLYKFAKKQGQFGPYVKRLIDQDMARANGMHLPTHHYTGNINHSSYDVEEERDNREAVAAFF